MQAYDAWKKSAELGYKEADSYYGIGLIDKRFGNKEKAKAEFLKALEIDPSYAKAQKALESLGVSESRPQRKPVSSSPWRGTIGKMIRVVSIVISLVALVYFISLFRGNMEFSLNSAYLPIKPTILLMAAGAICGLLLDGWLGAYQIWRRECLILGFSPGFLFYIPISIALLIAIGNVLALLRIDRRLVIIMVGTSSLFVSIACMIITFRGYSVRCHESVEFSLIYFIAFIPAMIAGLIFAVAYGFSFRKVSNDRSVQGKSKILGIIGSLLFIVIAILIWLPGIVIVPNIHGTVIDSDTQRPVGDAWIKAFFRRDAINQPHTRSAADGSFTIPYRVAVMTYSPLGLWKEDDISIYVHTADDKDAHIELRDFNWKMVLDVKVPVELAKKRLNDEAKYYSDIDGLKDYCRKKDSRRQEDACDEWELDYAITKHNRYLNLFPLTEETRSHRSTILEHLGLLYKEKGEYREAIEYLKQAKEISHYRPEDIDREITQIQLLIRERKE